MPRVCAGFGVLRKAFEMFSPPTSERMTSRIVLTYGSFDLFHQGHARLLQRLSMLGSELIVGCSTDAYSEAMGVPAVTSYAQRRLMLESCRFGWPRGKLWWRQSSRMQMNIAARWLIC